MKGEMETKKSGYHMVWIYNGYLSTSLSASTTLEPTRLLREGGWKVTLMCFCKENETQVRGVEVTCIPTVEMYFVGQFVFHWRAIQQIFREEPPVDIVLFHQDSGLWVFPLILMRNLKRETRPVYIMDNRSVPMPDPRTSGIKMRIRDAYTYIVNFLANYWADGQTAVTRRIAEFLKIPDKQLLGIWENGVTLQQFAPAAAKRRWPAPNEPVELIYIGAMEYERNIMNFCRAVVEANAAGMAFNLTLLGSGLQYDDLAKYAQGTDGRIKVIPVVPHEKVVDYLANAHLGVLPFPDEEKFRVSSPVKLFEYMASGTVVLATRIVCHTDVIKDSPCVFWVDGSGVDDFLATLKRAWQERSSFSRMGAQALASAQAFSWEESTERMRTALQSGLERRG